MRIDLLECFMFQCHLTRTKIGVKTSATISNLGHCGELMNYKLGQHLKLLISLYQSAIVVY